MAIQPADFLNELEKYSVGPYIEVPCSIFKHFLNYIIDSGREVIYPVSEAVGMGIAAGTYMSNKRIPVLAIQNSGFGNTINSLTSLHQIYDIPVLYLMTWRGEGGVGKDAPEHDIMGEKMEEFVKTFSLPYEIVGEKTYPQQINRIIKIINETKKPAVLILRKGIFSHYDLKTKPKQYETELSRFSAIKIIKKTANRNIVFISSNGFPSRDSFAAEETPDFYMMGSMGHALPIAIGVAKYSTKKVIVIDGDGSILMHTGAMASVPAEKVNNLIHVVLDNAAYDSTGGQMTVAPFVDFIKLGEAFGYRFIIKATTEKELETALKNAIESSGSTFIYVPINITSAEAGRRVSDIYTCQQVKEMFMKKLED